MSSLMVATAGLRAGLRAGLPCRGAGPSRGGSWHRLVVLTAAAEAGVRVGVGVGEGGWSRAQRRWCRGSADEKRLARKPAAPPGEPSPEPGPRRHEDVYTLPNLLTVCRLASAPVIGYLVLQDATGWAVGLLACSGLTDLLDGWIARRWKRQTVVGTVIDPMADKALMVILTGCLAAKGSLPVWVAAVILGRDFGLAIAALYYRYISLPPPKTFARYWDFSLPSAEVRPTTISKYNTFLQLGLVGLTTAAPLIDLDLGPVLSFMHYLVCATTIWSGASYVFSKDAVRILRNRDTRRP